MTRSEGAERFALHLRAYSDIPAPEREHRFMTGRRFAFDFAWPPPIKLAVEIDGGVHRIRGRWLADIEKFRAATILGWQVLHFRPAEVESGMAIDVIRAAFAGDKHRALALAVPKKGKP
jgi:very-short-patch-repair endonuclease